MDLKKEEKAYLIGVFIKSLMVKKELSISEEEKEEINRQIKALKDMLEMI